MNIIKSEFSIKDLENLTGIKAHTIRMWEKRYKLLTPSRTDTNIRLYDTANLQKLLNISLLNSKGYKISKIAELSTQEISDIAKTFVTDNNIPNIALPQFKVAMVNFNQNLFFETYDKLLKEKTFDKIFFEIFIPLLNEIGYLWQTETITPAHEHFISYLIKQKLLIQIEKLQTQPPTNTSKNFVLFLPPNEIHELGLLYLKYEILKQGYNAIYLGPSIPSQCLADMTKLFNKLVFVTYITVEPTKDAIQEYIEQLQTEILSPSNSSLWVFGKMTEFINTDKLTNQITLFQSIKEVSQKINQK